MKENFDLSSDAVNQIVSDKYHSSLLEAYGISYIKYRQKWTNVIQSNEEISFPLHIDLELFNSCNYRCSFCPYSLPAGERPKGFNVSGSKALKTELIEKVLKEANGRLCAVELGYNTEPLLHKNIIDIIKLCRQYNVLDIRMGTNGSLLGNVDSLELINSGLTQLQVSIDAVDDESYKNARNSTKYLKVTNSLKEFIESRDKQGSLLPRIRVTYVMTSENKENVDLFKEQWANLADIIGIQDLIVYSGSKLDLKQDNLKARILEDIPGCYMPKVRLSIRSDGAVHPCCTVPGMKLKIGDINQQTIESIWNSPAMKKIRQSHKDGSWKKNKICSDCLINTLH